MDEFFDIWDPPNDLIPKDTLPGIPRHGIGRGFKVSKENVVGLLTALRLFVEDNYESNYIDQTNYLKSIVSAISSKALETRIFAPEEGSPILTIRVNEEVLQKSAFEISRQLKNGNPGVFVQEVGLGEGIITIHPMNLNEDRTRILTKKLLSII